MIYPKCHIGKPLYIPHTGYVHPCCWFPYPDKINAKIGGKMDNPFKKDCFHLSNRSFADIITSDEWFFTLEKLKFDIPDVCNRKCSKFPIDLNLSRGSGSNDPKAQFVTSAEFEKYLVDYTDIVDLQIETTSRCTLQCPLCWRTQHKGQYKVTDLDFALLQDPLTYKIWDKVIDCGNFGDPIFYPHYHTMLKFMIEERCTKEYIAAVAATGKGTKWWDQTLEIMVSLKRSGTDVLIVFGIDGLEDTSNLYRKNQKYDEITYALKKTVEVGLRAIWQFIPFKHNEHQLETIRAMAKDLGAGFKLVQSDRFETNNPMKPANSALYYF